MDIQAFQESIFGSDKDFNKSYNEKPILHFPNDILSSTHKSWMSFFPYTNAKVVDAQPSNPNSPTTGLTGKREVTKQNDIKIYMYHPEQMSSSVSLNWEDSQAGWIDDIVKAYQSVSGDSSLENITDTVVSTGKSLVNRTLTGGVVKGKIEKSRGSISNPNLEVFFKGLAYREYSFSFLFSPKSRDEVDSMIAIIRAFKRYSLPQGKTSAYMSYPPYWKIAAVSKGKTINHFKPAVITNVNVDETPNQVWATFNSGEPVQVKLDVSFKEMELLTQEDYISGDASKDGWF